MAKEVVIILEESVNAKDFPLVSTNSSNTGLDAGTLIHQDEFNKVIEIITKSIPKNEEEATKKHLHNTVTVLGTRGSGKTSFLLSVKKSLEKDMNHDIEVLDIIDPTLIEEKGHVFLNTISLIISLVEKKLDKEECNASNNKGSVITRKDWRSSLNKLAAGLPSIDGLASSNADNWQDPEFVMDNGLKAVSASQRLAENFNEFLRRSLNILGKNAFLLMFDDIDVDSSKGWSVLETIRKYFTGGRLITLISGDLKLYSTVVRQRKWKNFGEEILKYEGKYLNKLNSFNSMITELESQYLQKILQPRNRIHLPTIGQRKRNNPDDLIYVYEKQNDRKKQHDEKYEIKNIYECILKYFGIFNKYQSDAYCSYMLGLPLRTQIQFLALFDLSSGVYLFERSGPAFLIDVFMGDLNANAIDVNLAVNNPKSLNRIILDFLINERKLEELYQLQPITTNYSLNASLISLNFLLSYNLKTDPYLIFDYFIKVGYIRNLVPFLGYRKTSESLLTPSVEELCENSIVINDNVLKDVTGRIIAYLRGTIDKEGANNDIISKGGTVPLYGEAATSKGNKEQMSGRVDRVLKDGKANFTQYVLAYLPLSSNQYIRKQSSLLTYSVYLLLGAIGELVRKVKIGDVSNGISELTQLRSYMMPDFRSGINESTLEANIEPQDRPSRIDGEIDIEALFIDWVNKYGECKISAHLLGKISTRFFFALSAIENGSNGKNLGDVFHAHIVALMNAVLIEDCKENTNVASKLTLSNTNFSDKNFVDNLKAIVKEVKRLEAEDAKSPEGEGVLSESFEKSISFSRWLISCPLLIAYLKEDNALKESVISYCGLPADYEVFSLKISAFLDKIYTKNKPRLSLDNKQHYAEIEILFVQHKIEGDLLNPDEANELSLKLAEMGIGVVTERSIKKFIEWKNLKQTSQK